MKQSILFLIIFLTALTACKKSQKEEKLTILSSSIKYQQSGELLPGFPVRFVENDALERFGHKKFLPYHKIFIKDTIYSDNLGNLEFVDFDLNEDLEYYVLVYNDTVYSFLHSIEVGKSNEFQILIDDLGFLKLSFYNDTNEYWAMSNEIYNYAINKFCLLDSNLIDTTLIFGLIPGTCKLTTCFYKSVIADTMIFETVEIIQNDTLELSYHY